MFRIPLLAALFLSLSISILAQSQANTGNIEGRVTDPNAASVPGVTVTATSITTGLKKSAQTNDEGVYRIVFLPPGAYKVETSGAQGFVPATFTNVIVTVGGQTPLDIQLAVGNAAVAMVDVSAEGQVVETTRTTSTSMGIGGAAISTSGIVLFSVRFMRSARFRKTMRLRGRC